MRNKKKSAKIFKFPHLFGKATGPTSSHARLSKSFMTVSIQ